MHWGPKGHPRPAQCAVSVWLSCSGHGLHWSGTVERLTTDVTYRAEESQFNFLVITSGPLVGPVFSISDIHCHVTAKIVQERTYINILLEAEPVFPLSRHEHVICTWLTNDTQPIAVRIRSGGELIYIFKVNPSVTLHWWRTSISKLWVVNRDFFLLSQATSSNNCASAVLA